MSRIFIAAVIIFSEGGRFSVLLAKPYRLRLKKAGRQRPLMLWSGLLPCAAMFPTVGSRWSGTMATTVMSAGAIGNKKTGIMKSPAL